MLITFNKSDFFNKLFPGIDSTNNDTVKQKLAKFYHPKKVKIQVDGDRIIVEFHDALKENKSNDFYRATDLCVKKKYQEAIPVFLSLIQDYPTDSEYHRNLAKSHQELGEYKRAIDHLIDTLRWNPSNHWALIIMGKIYFIYYNDLNTAMTNFDHVLDVDSNNNKVFYNF